MICIGSRRSMLGMAMTECLQVISCNVHYIKRYSARVLISARGQQSSRSLIVNHWSL